MEVIYKKIINSEKDNRMEFLLLNYDYIDGNDYLAKLFQEVYGFVVEEKIDGCWYSLLRIQLKNSLYEMVWHEDTGNEIYSIYQTEEENMILQQRLDNIINILNSKISNNS